MEKNNKRKKINKCVRITIKEKNYSFVDIKYFLDFLLDLKSFAAGHLMYLGDTKEIRAIF